MIPKNHQPDKWKLIVNLSDPAGSSVNDGIDRELRFLKYVSVDNLGLGILISKLDTESAYTQYIQQTDHYWACPGKVKVAFPFGLRSAPLVFTAVVDTVQWILKVQGVQHAMHYQVDYLILGLPDSPECQRLLEINVAKYMGSP